MSERRLLSALVHRLVPGVVEVKYRGFLGNQLFQYCLGRLIACHLRFSFYAPPLVGFPRAGSFGNRVWRYVPARRLQALVGGHRVDLAAIARNRTPRLIVLNGLFCRYEYYRPFKDVIRGLWLCSDGVARSDPDDLTIHIRTGPDLWQDLSDGKPVNPEYHALPFSFYRGVIEAQRWRAIHVVTENPLDSMVGKLVATYGAEVHSGGALADFNRLRSASNLVLSVSTFAWWAGWLSAARRIYYPVAGLFDSERARGRPWLWQQDLWVSDEDRYVAVTPAVSGDWLGRPEERQRLLES
jgi:hypothetical protein